MTHNGDGLDRATDSDGARGPVVTRLCRICGKPLDGLVKKLYCIACRFISEEWVKK